MCRPCQNTDPEVDEWHLDLVNLTLGVFSEFASAIRCEGDIIRHNQNNVITAIKASLNKRFITLKDINPNLKPSLHKRGIELPGITAR